MHEVSCSIDPFPSDPASPPVPAPGAGADEEASSPGSSLDRALDLLFAIHEAGRPMGVSQLARQCAQPKSSTHRLLQVLARRGLLDRDPRARYRPGFAWVALGLGVLDGDPLVAAARPVLRDWAERLGETFFVVTDRAGRLVVLDKAEGSGFLRVAPRVGEQVPAHATAVGTLYRALAPERLTEDVPGPPGSAGLPGFEPEEIRRELERVAAEGVARNRDGWIEGLSAVAAPVWGRGRLEGTVALAAPTARMDRLGPAQAIDAARSAAARVGERLSGALPDGGGERE